MILLAESRDVMAVPDEIFLRLSRRIADEPQLLNHAEAIHYFNRLLIDLTLQELGLDYDAIEMARLSEGSRHVQALMQCTRPATMRR